MTELARSPSTQQSLRQEGRVAVVTGGAGGIGAATAARLAVDGAAVAVLDLDEAAAAAVAKQLPHGGMGVRCDITDRDEVAAAVDAVVERFGRIDVLANIAGRLLRTSDVLDLAAADWATSVGVNLTGPFTVTQAVARVMRDAGYGRITFVSSLAALGNPGQAHYAAAKAGVAGLARTVALELGPFGVTSNVVAPGWVVTDMFRNALRDRGRSFDEFEADAVGRVAVRRLGQPDDIAAAVAFFSLPESGFVTGQTLYATGHPT